AIPSFLTRSVLAQAADARSQGKRLVVIFQRGAADGLNIVIPHGDPGYYQLRSSIAVQPRDLIDLDGFYGLHPAMASLKPIWDRGYLAAVHACGSPDTTRSHFDAQDYMESGTPGVKSTQDGWLNRALQSERPAARPTAFRAIALGTALPRTLEGPIPAVAIGNVRDFSIGTGPAMAAAGGQPSDGFASMYASSVNAVLHGTGGETFDAIRMLKSTDPAHYTPANGVNYPKGPFGESMKQIAQLMKADLGVEVAFAEIGGWDTHQNQGGATGQLANRLREFSDSLSAFWGDLGDQGGDVVLVTMSEFGRTARQNGSGGTDHGHANVMFLMGGPARGGKVYGRWPGLGPDQLNEGRDLTVTTDFRAVLAEATQRVLTQPRMEKVFPGISLRSNDLPGILKA
ncbi:MAG TPA: DUF1501 domain-containing protein, partial [Acidobacteriaceae bacterium]